MAALPVLAFAWACSSTPSGDPPPPVETGLSYCLERPDQLPHAPAGHLPCELIPPGLTL